MSDNSRRYLTTLFGLDAVVRRVAGTGAGWDATAPCEGWTAADVVGHNIAMNHMIAGLAKGQGSKGAADMVPADPEAEWQESFEQVFAALDSEGALQTVTMTPWGELPVDKFLGFVWVDPLIHSWDLAMATGQDPALDADLVAAASARLERAGESLVSPGRFKAAAPINAEMSPVDKLVSLSGRDAAWTP